MALQYFDVWQVDTGALEMRGYVEDQYGRIASGMGEWEPIPASLADLHERLVSRGGYQRCHGVTARAPFTGNVEKWSRVHNIG